MDDSAGTGEEHKRRTIHPTTPSRGPEQNSPNEQEVNLVCPKIPESSLPAGLCRELLQHGIVAENQPGRFGVAPFDSPGTIARSPTKNAHPPSASRPDAPIAFRRIALRAAIAESAGRVAIDLDCPSVHLPLDHGQVEQPASLDMGDNRRLDLLDEAGLRRIQAFIDMYPFRCGSLLAHCAFDCRTDRDRPSTT